MKGRNDKCESEDSIIPFVVSSAVVRHRSWLQIVFWFDLMSAILNQLEEIAGRLYWSDLQ